MAVENPKPATVLLRDENGREVARLLIWSSAKGPSRTGEAADLISWSPEEAARNGEEPVQLRERGRYVYRIDGPNTDRLALEESLVISRSPASPRDGFIETGDQCGTLPLILLRDDLIVARGAVEVRSLKLGYREDYRGMLKRVADKCVELLFDCRAGTRLRLESKWQNDPVAIEQQLEFLRHTLDSAAFRNAVDEVLRNPHRRLEDEVRDQSISRPFKPGRDIARQIAGPGARINLPHGHPLSTEVPALTSVPARIRVSRRTDFLDTAENRFVKMMLVEFRDFLAETGAEMGRATTEQAKRSNARLLRETARLRGQLDSTLARGFLPDVSRPTLLPLGSPVIQRKAGYRELLRCWMQFHVGAQLSWAGGKEIWTGGARNTATLYEYWLFFQLEELFRDLFKCSTPLHALIAENDNGIMRLKLERGVEMHTPVGGTWSEEARRPLKAEFRFNHKFLRNPDHRNLGSWTRGVQPDYTISIWPAEFSKDEAEACEVLVHIHFDAKYRVQELRSVFGDKEDDEVISDRAESVNHRPTAAKYADLLKMHAYRDAIRRTAGAYVLYPGAEGSDKEFQGFHEVLPGLGAFAIAPDAEGRAKGVSALRDFLNRMIAHLSNRTTARERSSYHLARSYAAGEVEEKPLQYGELQLPEHDNLAPDFRALPPAEHYVVVAWYKNEAQLKWTETEGMVLVRLGDRPGTWHVPPEFASARHVLLHTHGRFDHRLFRLKKDHPGYKVFTAQDVLDRGYPGPAKGEIYAVFEVEEDHGFPRGEWDEGMIRNAQNAFDKRWAYRPTPHSRRSADPRVLSLRELLAARRKPEHPQDVSGAV